MKVIGHRGAAGLELENTAASLKKAVELGVDAIEVDVRETKDHQLVLCHDETLIRIADNPARIRDLTLAELQAIQLPNGESLISLAEALQLIGQTSIIIELKEKDTAPLLLKVLHEFPKVHASVTSFKLSELVYIHDKQPSLQLYLSEMTKPFEVIHLAAIHDISGIGLNYRLLNPVTYWRIHHRHKQLFVWTVNNVFIAGFIHLLYPQAAICTDRPDKLLMLKKRLRV